MFDYLRGLNTGELLGLAGICGLVLIVVPGIIFSQWRKAREARIEADLKRDLIAKEVSVEDILRLTTPASVQEFQIEADRMAKQAQIEADAKTKEAQIAADLKREMLARGLSVEEVERLSSTPDTDAQAREESRALANVISNMIQDGVLDRDAVEGLLEVFLKKELPAQIPEDFKRALLARGLAAEEVEHLARAESDAPRVQQDCVGLAAAITSMVQEGGELDQDVVAELLEMYLKKERSHAENQRRQLLAQRSAEGLPRVGEQPHVAG